MCESEPRNTEDRYAVAVIRDSTMVRHQRRGRIIIVSVCLEDEQPSLQIHCRTLHAYIVMLLIYVSIKFAILAFMGTFFNL